MAIDRDASEKKSEHNLPKLHSRERKTDLAHCEVSTALIAIRQKYDLTATEELQILTMEMQTILKYCLREERHGDASKPAGLE